MLYGFPDIDGSGIKAAFHHTGQYVTPQTLERSTTQVESDALRTSLARWLPRGAGRVLASVVCMYTLTPDLHFLIGRHPREPAVVIAGGFSGHGFKFCSVIGEVLADLAISGTTRHPIELFSPRRAVRSAT
jgi:sarcosine oxidase